MKSLVVFVFGVTIFLFSGIQVFAQDKADTKYRTQSEAIRKQVWAWVKPEFKVKDIPAEYAKLSKVVIAHHTELSADSKSKLTYNWSLLPGTKKEASIIEIVREMVKINDRAAVNEYSELNFNRFEKISGFVKSKSTSFVGVRVMKPNGQVKEINADDIVLTKDVADEKQAKLAVPDLEPGDIIDYFIATEQVLTNDFTAKSYNVILFDPAPVLHYSFHGQLGKKFAIDYRSYNGAPDLEVSKSEDKDIIVDVEKKNMPPFETSLWVSPGLQLPFIRMNISLGLRRSGFSNPGEVNKNKAAKELVKDKADMLGADYCNSLSDKAARYEFGEVLRAAKRTAKQTGLSFKDMSKEEKATQIYYVLRFTKLLDFNIDEMQKSINIGKSKFNGMAWYLYCLYDVEDLDEAILISNSRNGFRMSEIMDTDDLESYVYLKGSNSYFTIRSIYDCPYYIPETIEGIQSGSSARLVRNVIRPSRIDSGIKVPMSEATKNAHIEQLSLTVNPGQAKLGVKRKTLIKGHYKTDLQSDLILYEDIYESERKALGEEHSLIESLEKSKYSRKHIDEVKSALAVARKEQKTAFEEEAQSWFAQEISDLKNHKVENLGVRHTSPDFVYSSEFNIDGLVKKAGNNLILDIGKIQGSLLSISEEQRKRELDVYMPFARSIEYGIEIKIPDGYTAEGIEALNKKVSNQTGFFAAEATANAKTITIKLKKHYLHNYEPITNWSKMVEFINASSEWTNAKILLKKI